MVADLGRGLTDVMRGARFVAARPRLWKWVIAPALLALVILVAVVGTVVVWTAAARAGLVAVLPEPLEGWVSGALGAVIGLVLALAAYVVFLSLAVLLSAPFNEFLSEAIEQELTGQEPPPFRVLIFLRDVLLGIAHASRRVIAYGFVMLALLLASLIVPWVGQALYVAGGGLVSARFAAYDAFDAVWARKGWRYGEKIRYLRAHRTRSYGIGTAVALWMLVPGLNLFALSAGAAGATLAYLDTRGPT